jgi:colanic acid/amylovoran biosynthesis glycosyltransferase
MIERAGAFIAVSEYIRKRLLEQGYPDSKIILHRNGIDLDYFCPSSDVEREPIIVFVGRFVEKKGGEYLLDAARQLHESGVRFELVMIGGGPLESSLKAGRPERDSLPVHRLHPGSEVRQWLNRASVVAIPSVVASDGDSEGLPTIQLEAQAMGAPVVATRHSGIPEGVIEGVTAELVDERDTRALAMALRSFLESRDKVRDFGEAGREVRGRALRPAQPGQRAGGHLRALARSLTDACDAPREPHFDSR